jgi:1-acyl-sn-glycerol-3-phosphate acyltransferase
MEGIFITLYRYFRNRRLVFFSILILFGFTAAFIASRISFEEDISNSVPGDNEQTAFIINNSRLTNKIIVHISLQDTSQAADPGKLTDFADDLTDSLLNGRFTDFIDQSAFRTSDTLIENIMSLMVENLPLFLSEEDYQRMDSLLLPEKIDRAMEKNLRSLLSPTSFTMKKSILRDPLGLSSLAFSKLRQFQFEKNYELLNGYVFTNNRKSLLVFINPLNSPSETGKNGLFFKQLDNLLNELLSREKHVVKVEYYGASAVAVGNAEQIKNDIAVTVTVAIIIILVFIGWYFRKVSIPFISFLPAVFGGITALAIMFIFRDKLSIIALGIGSVLLGIIVDYALYFYCLYKSKGSVELVIRDLTLSIVMCSLTSAIAFFSLLFVKSEVLRDLGLFAGLSILGAALFSLTILPHLAKLEKTDTDKEKINPIIKLMSYPFESNWFLIMAIVLISVVFFYFSRKAGFETDMYSINYLSPKLKEAEKGLYKINDISLKSVFIVSTGDNLDQALLSNTAVLRKLDSLKNADVIRKYSNVGTILMPDSIQQIRLKRWKEYWSVGKKKDLNNVLIKTGNKYGFNRGAFNGFFTFLDTDFKTLDIAGYGSLRKLFLNDMITETEDLTLVMSLVKVKNEVRHQVYTEFAGVENCIVIDRQEITSGFVDLIRKDFDLLVNLCLLFVTMTLLISFGRIETGLIASIPMFISWLWTLGFMGITGIEFNIINIIVTTFVFGLGVDYSILMMRGLLLEYKYGQHELTTYKTSIFLSSFTTLVGVGALFLAKQPSLHSISLISVVGLVTVVLVSYTLTPVMFNWLVSKKKIKRVIPVTFSDALVTILVFGIFVGGSLFLNLVLLLVIIMPVSGRRKKYFMHQCLAFFSKIPVYTMVHIRKTIVNTSGEDFTRPSVIISNHQSHIDLLLLLMLNPRIIAITNKWVWNNPIYALVIRYLEFYPVTDGYDEIIEKLKPSVKQGYSILVFPEGSRSPDASIRRFHKGAFIMAEKLGLDILPVLIHGASDCMNKGENHLKSGFVTMKIYPRIKADDPSFGHDYHMRTKSIQTFYRQEWLRIREELETPDYFRSRLIRNYIYKGPVLEWYTRIKLKLEDNYNLINSYIPRKASVVDIGCGYGFLSHMLSFVSPDRKILGIDYDDEKINLANNCLSNNASVNFVMADATVYTYEQVDVFILGDVLHYVPDDKQESLLRHCIQHLNPGGTILVRDADKDYAKRHMGTRYTEFYSTRSGFNKSIHNRLFFFSGSMIREVAENHGLQLEIIDNSRFTSNILYVMKKPLRNSETILT